MVRVNIFRDDICGPYRALVTDGGSAEDVAHVISYSVVPGTACNQVVLNKSDGSKVYVAAGLVNAPKPPPVMTYDEFARGDQPPASPRIPTDKERRTSHLANRL